MTNPRTEKPKLKQLGKIDRKAVNVSSEGLTKTSYFQPKSSLPLIIEPTVEGLNLTQWIQHNREAISTQLLKHGGLLFRGFQVDNVTGFEQFLRSISGELLEYSFRSTPRSQVKGNIYTSTEYPSEQFIPLHNEMAYARSYPLKIAFYCLQAASQGGETPIADSRKVFQLLDPEIKQKFQQKRVMYVRNYGGGVDLTWQTVFNTNNKSDVEYYCQRSQIEFEWKDSDRLQTRQVCPAIAKHPQTAETVWFNQAHLFHISNLEHTVREQLLTHFKPEDLPRNAYYGDGSPIEDAVLAEIRKVYQQVAIIFPWQQGDVLLLDNLLAAHGRMPFTGARKIVVGMAEQIGCQDI